MSCSLVAVSHPSHSFGTESTFHLMEDKERQRRCASPTESLSASSSSASVTSEDSVDFHTDAVELECVACQCFLCGREFRSCLQPRGEYPDFSLFLHNQLGWNLSGPSVPALVLPFSSGDAMRTFWSLLRTSLTVRAHVWWSARCYAGQPRSFCLNGTELDEGYDDFGFFRGPGECCMLVVLDPPEGLDGFWTDETATLEIRRLLGCLAPSGIVDVLTPVDYCASGELVPHAHMRTWMSARSGFLTRCRHEVIEPPEQADLIKEYDSKVPVW